MANLKEESKEAPSEEVADLRRLITNVQEQRNKAGGEVVSEPCLHAIGEVKGSLSDLKLPEGVLVNSWSVSSGDDRYRAVQAEVKHHSCQVTITEKSHSETNRVEYLVEEGTSEHSFNLKKPEKPRKSEVEAEPVKGETKLESLLNKFLDIISE